MEALGEARRLASLPAVGQWGDKTSWELQASLKEKTGEKFQGCERKGQDLSRACSLEVTRHLSYTAVPDLQLTGRLQPLRTCH